MPLPLARAALIGSLRALLLVVVFGWSAMAGEPAGYVGQSVCAGCHAKEAAAWAGSHHDQAMQAATPATVLGDFADATLDHFGIVSRFYRSGDTYRVRTEGPDGSAHDYDIAFTFGVYPLQQYLIAMPGGRLQALGIAWDSRPKQQGGQRWFPLYPDQRLPVGDRLHWTGRDQTWNHMCAACHSTDLQKHFDLATNTYATTWSEVNVACEACHGPGSVHVAWAAQHQAPASAADHMGLTAWLKPTDSGVWEMDTARGIARRTQPLMSQELDACAGCHARRRPIAEPAAPGGKLLDSYSVAYLEPGLYHADGQIDGEVFEYGSFVQSRMFHAGVTCSDCHDPHALTLRAEGNAVCAQCHMPAKFDVSAHTHHPAGSPGAQCVACHMPSKTYMVVDDRRDHSLRVPRPDLTLTIGTPNACSQCHRDKSAAWAAQAVAAWFPQGRQTTPHYGTALAAGRSGAPGAEALLDTLIGDPSAPAIARGSALLLLGQLATPASEPAIRAAARDPDDLVRAAVPRAVTDASAGALLPDIAPLLRDPVRAVRIETARALAGVDPASLTPDQRLAYVRANQELIDAERIESETPEAHLNIGLIDQRRQDVAAAAADYETALRLDPAFVPAMVNLADLDRMRGQEQAAAALLEKAQTIAPDNADVHHALGLQLVRRHDYAGALTQLRQAAVLAPDNARYAYVYAVALNATGSADQALAVLQQAHQRHPADRDVLTALIGIARDTHALPMALAYARALAALDPGDQQARMLVLALQAQLARDAGSAKP